MLRAGRSPVRVPGEVDFFSLSNPSSSTVALVSTQPLKELSTRNVLWGKERPAHQADNLTAICKPTIIGNVVAWTSHNSMYLHGLLQGWLYLFTRKQISAP
jgi:hypothetical protein